MKTRRYLAILVAVLGSLHSAQAEVMIIGAHSSLEKFNPLRESLVLDTLRLANNNNEQSLVFFNDGNDNTVDAFNSPKDGSISPLSIVFEQNQSPGIQYRNHSVDNAKAATASVIQQALRPFYDRQGAGRSWLMLFGDSKARMDVAGFDMALQGDDQLGVEQIARAQNLGASSGSRRYFADYCGSSALNRLDRPSTLNTDAESCGFTSYSVLENLNRCSGPENTNQHQYARLWIEAQLDDSDTNVSQNADFNRDGIVTPLEAHHYAYVYLNGPQIPASSSEAFLATWGKLFVPLLPANRALPKNQYQVLADLISRRLGYSQNIELMLQTAHADRTLAQERITAIEQQIQNKDARYAQLAAEAKNALIRRWPELARPYSAEFLSTLMQRSSALIAFIVNHEHYTALLNIRLDRSALQRERDKYLQLAGSIDRLFKMRYLSRMLHRLNQIGGRSDLARYQSLLSCETLAFAAEDTLQAGKKD